MIRGGTRWSALGFSLALMTGQVPAQSMPEVPGCVLWLRADAGVVTNEAGAATFWTDQSGRGNHAAMTNSDACPQLVPGALNGRPVLRFDGSNDSLRVADSATLDGVPGLSLFAVLKPANLSTSTARGLLSKRVMSNTEAAYTIFFYTGNALWVDLNDQADRFATQALFTNNLPVMISTVYSGSLVDTQRVSVFVNGALDRQARESSSVLANRASDLGIGTMMPGGFLGMDLAELVISTNALNAGQRTAMEQYLRAKYLEASTLLPSLQAIGVLDGTAEAATFTADLISTGAAPTDVWCCWGPADGGTNLADWAAATNLGAALPGPVAHRATGLTPRSVYHWRFAASNAFGVAWTAPAQTFRWGLGNDAYDVEDLPDGTARVVERATGASADFAPAFEVVYSATNPGLSDGTRVLEPAAGVSFHTPAWGGDADFFSAPGSRYAFAAIATTNTGSELRWTFATTNGIGVEARLTVPAGSAPPALWFRLRAGAAGWYAVGYTGAPEYVPDDLSWIWQPLVWQERRFPTAAFLTPEYLCSVPAVLAGVSNAAVGLAVDPAALHDPFADAGKMMVDLSRSRFGVIARTAAGTIRPMVFAPVYGGTGSSHSAGGTTELTLRLLVRAGGWYASYRHYAQALYGFSDYRENGLCSMNETLDNMVDFIMASPYAYWLPEYKCWSYENDKPGYGREQSAADSVSLAMVRDSRALYDRLGLPTLEYAVSRKYALMRVDGIPDPEYPMGGPVTGKHMDLAGAFLLSGGRATALRTLAERGLASVPNSGVDKDAMSQLLMRYRMGGNPAALAGAFAMGTNYIAARFERGLSDGTDVHSSFWHEIGPAWYAMLELYDETGDARFRDAFVQGLQEFAAYAYLQPICPSGMVTVEGITGTESVPAWRVDPRGLTPEAMGTADSHRGIFMSPYAAYMLRGAAHSGDPFMKAVGRAAVVGRFANYPGYAYRDELSSRYEKPNWCLRPYASMRTQITAHFNHSLPQCAYLVEFLVADAETRAADAIHFPSRYSDTGAYFKHKVYGDRPGRFFGETNVWLWLPRGLLTNDSIQVNYLAARGDDRLCVALMNQCGRTVTNRLSLNTNLVAYPAACGARLWLENIAQPDRTLTNGALHVVLAPYGMAALVITGLTARVDLQTTYAGEPAVPLPTGALVEQTGTPFGKVGAMLFAFGPRLASAYVWLETNALKSATLHYATGSLWEAASDTNYPFEFTVPLADAATPFRGYVEGLRSGGGVVSNALFNLGWRLEVHSDHGTPLPPAGAMLRNVGEQVVCSVVSPVERGGTRYVCDGWAVAGASAATGTSAVVTMTNNLHIAWLWSTQQLLTVAVGEGILGGGAGGWYAHGTPLSLTITPPPYQHFVNWTGDVAVAAATNQPLELTMEAPRTIGAVYADDLALGWLPVSWLAAHGWTNDFDSAAQSDGDHDGLFTWEGARLRFPRTPLRPSGCCQRRCSRPACMCWHGPA